MSELTEQTEQTELRNIFELQITIPPHSTLPPP